MFTNRHIFISIYAAALNSVHRDAHCSCLGALSVLKNLHIFIASDNMRVKYEINIEAVDPVTSIKMYTKVTYSYLITQVLIIT